MHKPSNVFPNRIGSVRIYSVTPLCSIRIQYGFGIRLYICKWRITWRVLILKKPICCKMASACTFGLGSTITLAACHCIATSTSHCHFSKKPICLFKIFQNILFEHLRIASFLWDQMYRFSPRGVCLPLSGQSHLNPKNYSYRLFL